MLKNSYAFTRDMHINCAWLCGSLCPKKVQGQPLCPSPCCGDHHFQIQMLEIRETTKALQQTTQALMAESEHKQMTQFVHGQTVVGSFKQNIDTPYCCWCKFHCGAEHYDTLQINAKRIAKITMPFYCCTPQYAVADQSGNQFGKITQGYQRCCYGKSYTSLVDTVSGKQTWGIYRHQGCQLKLCFDHFDIKNPQRQIKGQIVVKPLICVGCCHCRQSIDISFPEKATQKDKALILSATRRYRG